MKNSPLQVGEIVYTDVSIRARPGVSAEAREQTLPVQVEAEILYDDDGDHFALVRVRQLEESLPYTLDVAVFANFLLDAQGCKEAYRTMFNPGVIGANIARVLYSSLKDMIATVSARAPYGAARMPTLLLEPSDVSIAFAGDEEAILRSQFAFDDDAIARLRAKRQEQATATDPTAKKSGAQKSRRSRS